MIRNDLFRDIAEAIGEWTQNHHTDTGDANELLQAVFDERPDSYTGPFFSPHTGVRIPQGEWSHGTCRNEDIIPVLMSQLEDLWPERAKKLQSEYSELGWPTGNVFNKEQQKLAPELATELYDSIEELLHEAGMTAWRIGSHPGDGSSIGVWMCLEMEDKLELEAFPFQLGAKLPNGAKILMVSDTMHGEGTHPTRIVLCHTESQSFATWYLCEPEDAQEPFCVVGHYFGYEEFKEAINDYWKRCDELGVQQLADEILS